MTKVKVSTLQAHPQNDYFFDDMAGTKWEEFLESVRTSGIIEPIVITKDNVIVSGHQRVRACKELGIEEIEARIKDYANDDEVIKDLLETNIRQRGNIDSSGTKLGRTIKELERIYGIRTGRGGDRTSNPTMLDCVEKNVNCQQDIANMLNTNKETYRLSKQIADLIPELQEMEISGNITASVASRILAKLSIDEQIELFAALPKDVKLSQKEVQDSIKKLQAQIKERDEDMQEMTERIAEKREETNRELKKRDAAIKSMEAEIAAKMEEVEAKKAEAAKLKAILDDENRDAAGEYIFKVDELQVKLRAEQEKRAQEKAEHNKERKEAQKKLDDLAIETKKYITERDNYNNQLKSLNAELEEAKARAAAADPLLVEQYRQLVVDKENEVADMKDKIATLEKQTQFRTPLDMFRVFDLVIDMLYAYANSGTIKEMANNSDEFISRLSESADRISDAAEMIRNIRGTNCEMRAI
jgi:ParB family transcriptional regulator, chromosome partitioning protein